MAFRSASVAVKGRTNVLRVDDQSDPAFLRGLLGGIRCGVLAVDREGLLTLINQHACEILGFAEPPQPGTPVERALADHPRLVRVLRDAFSLTTLPNRAELDLGPHRRKGKRIGFTMSHVPDEHDDHIGAAVFFKDLTRIERSEEKERLKDRLAVLGEMAAHLAHEVRNPLASIEVTCGLLRRRLAADEAGRDLLDKITAEVRRLNGTVSATLEFVKPMTSAFRASALLPLLEESILVAGRHGPHAGTTIRLERACELPPFRMDPDQLRQIFENLLINAAEAAGENGNVAIEIERAAAPDESDEADPWSNCDEFVVIRVSDDGPGIAPETSDRIFHPFFTTKVRGSGVGLSTVKRIVDNHGGLIDVDRGALGGARFTVRLPMILAKHDHEVPQQ